MAHRGLIVVAIAAIGVVTAVGKPLLELREIGFADDASTHVLSVRSLESGRFAADPLEVTP
jgi:hypothetical protein